MNVLQEIARAEGSGMAISFGIVLGLIAFCFVVLAILLGRPVVESYRQWRRMRRNW